MKMESQTPMSCRECQQIDKSPGAVVQELTKSTISYFWSLSLLGAQQMADTVFSPDKAAESFYVVGQSMVDEFGDLLNGAYQIGDAAQDYAADLAFDTLTLRAFSPAYISRLGVALAEQSSDTLTNWAFEENRRLVVAELKNKYEVYNLVKTVRTLLAVPEHGEFPIGDLIVKAYALGAYPDLWAVEGLGHDYAVHSWNGGKPIRNLLTDETARSLPAKSMTMLHAGIGLAFAEKLMPKLTPYSSRGEISDVLDQFISLCRENSREGYVGAAYESLGLVTRTWHPQLVPIVDAYLGGISEELLGHFWHGVGRALYFLPLYFVPELLSAWTAADEEPPHEIGHRNAIAGLAWATTLVNMRQPEIMLRLLRQRGEQLAQTDAFSNGVASACIVGWDITPGDVYIESFCQYQPANADRELTALWQKLAANAGREALQNYYPVLKKHDRLGEVFRYQSLADLTARLNRS